MRKTLFCHFLKFINSCFATNFTNPHKFICRYVNALKKVNINHKYFFKNWNETKQNVLLYWQANPHK